MGTCQSKAKKGKAIQTQLKPEFSGQTLWFCLPFAYLYAVHPVQHDKVPVHGRKPSGEEPLARGAGRGDAGRAGNGYCDESQEGARCRCKAGCDVGGGHRK